MKRIGYMCLIAVWVSGCQIGQPQSTSRPASITLELRSRVTTESSFKYGIRIGERTYFHRVGDEFLGFRIISHKRIPNPEANVKRPMLDTLTLEKSECVFVLTNGIPYTFTETEKTAQQ